MKTDSSFVKKDIKRWWPDTLFIFEVQIWLVDISINLSALVNLFNLKIKTKISQAFYNNHGKSLYTKNFRFNEHKSGNINLIFYNNLKTGISISKLVKTDHTPFELEIGILGFTFYYYTYDHRHWDDDNDRYEECERECVDCDLEET